MPADNREAVRLFGLASLGDDTDAKVEYAIALYNGDGVTRNQEIAAALFHKAALKNNPVAQNRLAHILSSGLGAPADPVAATKWHLISKARGETDSALDDFEDGIRGYVLRGRVEYLGNYLADVAALTSISPAFLAELDAFASTQMEVKGEPTPISAEIGALLAAWNTAIRLVEDNQRSAAELTLLSMHATEGMDRLRAQTAGFDDQLVREAAEIAEWGDLEQMVIQGLNIGGAMFAIIAMIYAFGSITRAITSGFAAKQQVEELFSMADMLQSAAGQEDTNEVLRNTAAKLLPEFSGMLYVFNNSRDRLDLSMRWGELAETTVDHISPTSCWALKRGKPHLNLPGEGALRCDHASPSQAILEVPMAARGQLYGLLAIVAEEADATAKLNSIRPIANAMGDAMSLALSSIALREQLRSSGAAGSANRPL